MEGQEWPLHEYNKDKITQFFRSKRFFISSFYYYWRFCAIVFFHTWHCQQHTTLWTRSWVLSPRPHFQENRHKNKRTGRTEPSLFGFVPSYFAWRRSRWAQLRNVEYVLQPPALISSDCKGHIKNLWNARGIVFKGRGAGCRSLLRTKP